MQEESKANDRMPCDVKTDQDKLVSSQSGARGQRIPEKSFEAICDLLEGQLRATNKPEELMALYADMFGIEDDVV